MKYKLLYLYDDDDGEIPHLIIDPPPNLDELLKEYNVLDAAYCADPQNEQLNWLPAIEWLRNRGVQIVEVESIFLPDLDIDSPSL